MKELKQHLHEYELIRRATAGEEGEIDQTMIRKAVQNWALSGHRRLKEIDTIVRDVRAALSGQAVRSGYGFTCRFAPRKDKRHRTGGAHLRKKVKA